MHNELRDPSTPSKGARYALTTLPLPLLHLINTHHFLSFNVSCFWVDGEVDGRILTAVDGHQEWRLKTLVRDTHNSCSICTDDTKDVLECKQVFVKSTSSSFRWKEWEQIASYIATGMQTFQQVWPFEELGQPPYKGRFSGHLSHNLQEKRTTSQQRTSGWSQGVHYSPIISRSPLHPRGWGYVCKGTHRHCSLQAIYRYQLLQREPSGLHGAPCSDRWPGWTVETEKKGEMPALAPQHRGETPAHLHRTAQLQNRTCWNTSQEIFKF